MSKSVSVDNAYAAYWKALQDFYILKPGAEGQKTRGLGKVSSTDVGQRSQSVLDQSRNFGDALVTALEIDEPDRKELLSWKLLAVAAYDLSTASYMLEVSDANQKPEPKARTRSPFDPMSSLKEILDVPMETGIYGLTKPVTRRAMSDNPEAAKEKLRKTTAIFLDEIPDAAASMSETAASNVISAGLIPGKKIVSDVAGQILEHLPTTASIILQRAALLLAEAVRKIEAALGKGVTERVKDEVTSWLNEIMKKHDTVTKLLDRLYETKRIGVEISIYISTAPVNTPAERFNQATRTLEDLLSRYSMTKKVLEGVMKVLGLVQTPLLAAVPWGPIGVYGTYLGVLTYAILSGGDYLDWYRLEEKAWLNRVSGLRITVRNSLIKKESKTPGKTDKNDSSGKKIDGASVHEKGNRSIPIPAQAYQEDGLLDADTHISITASLEAKLIRSKDDKNMTKTKILFFASNPQSTNMLNLGEEARSITSKIREAEYRDSLEFVTAWAARPTDLLDEMNKHSPNILHFSGHGSGEEGLVFTNDQGKSELVSTDALKTLFSKVKNDIRLIVFNACFSVVQGKAISKIIECVIGMNKSIGDEAAISFAAYFYSALAYGHSVKDAFAQGKTALMLLSIPEEKTPVLLCRKDIDPSRVFLVHADEVDYSKIHKIDNDNIGNIILKDINGSTITVNYNDIEKLKPVLQNLSDTQTFEVKQLIGNQHREILTEIRRIQDQSDEKNTIQKAENNLNDLDDFFKELTSMKIENAKNLIITLYKLLREYEEKIIIEDDPKHKMRYQREMESIKDDIAANESELKSILK